MFSAFCGLGIHNVLMYERIFKALAKQKVALEVLSYHAAAPSNEAERMAVSRPPVPILTTVEPTYGLRYQNTLSHPGCL